jgi:ERCC4-type nuclease
MLKPSDVTIIVDTREQTPFNFERFGFKTKVCTLKTGDYSVEGLEDKLSIERKSLSDLLGCVGKSRQRFERELLRLKEFDAKAVVVSANEATIARGNWKRSKITPKQVIGSYTAWMTLGIPFIFASNHTLAEERAAHFLWLYARKHLNWGSTNIEPSEISEDQLNKVLGVAV